MYLYWSVSLCWTRRMALNDMHCVLQYGSAKPKGSICLLVSKQILPFGFAGHSKAKRQYLLTCKISRYCLLALHSEIWIWSTGVVLAVDGPHRNNVGCGLLYSFHLRRASCFNMAVSVSDRQPKVRKWPKYFNNVAENVLLYPYHAELFLYIPFEIYFS